MQSLRELVVSVCSGRVSCICWQVQDEPSVTTGGGGIHTPPGSVDSPPWGNCYCCHKTLSDFHKLFHSEKDIRQYYVLIKYCIPLAGYEIPLYICCRSLQAKLVSSSNVDWSNIVTRKVFNDLMIFSHHHIQKCT